MKTALLLAALACAAAHPAQARQVKTSTQQGASGERVLRVETTLAQAPETVWKSFATEAGLRCWAAPVVRLTLKTGGTLETNYDKAAKIGAPGTITLRIMNVVEPEVMTYKVTLNDHFSARLREEDGWLQEVIQLQRLANGGTRIVSSMVGWGQGKEWDDALAFFARGNEWSYKKLAACLNG